MPRASDSPRAGQVWREVSCSRKSTVLTFFMQGQVFSFRTVRTPQLSACWKSCRPRAGFVQASQGRSLPLRPEGLSRAGQDGPGQVDHKFVSTGGSQIREQVDQIFVSTGGSQFREQVDLFFVDRQNQACRLARSQICSQVCCLAGGTCPRRRAGEAAIASASGPLPAQALARGLQEEAGSRKPDLASWSSPCRPRQGSWPCYRCTWWGRTQAVCTLARWHAGLLACRRGGLLPDRRPDALPDTLPGTLPGIVPGLHGGMLCDGCSVKDAL